MKQGLTQAKKQLNSILGDFLDGYGDSFDVTEIEVSASFSADGKFLGFGVGGAATITLRIKPS